MSPAATKRIAYFLIGASVAFSVFLIRNAVVSRKSSPPNILLISIDDLNDWVGCLGGHPQARTPNLDRFASQGTLFTNAHCQSPVCQPSRASLMTSSYPSSTGLYFLNPGIAAAEVLAGVETIPERFAREGYKVMAAGKVFHGQENQHYFSRTGKYGGTFGAFGPSAPGKISYPEGHPLWDWGAYPKSDESMPDYKVTQWAKKQLNQKHDQPFFLAVGFWRPHVPMLVPQKWFDLHPQDRVTLPEVQDDDLGDVSRYAQDLIQLKHVSPAHEWVVSHGQWWHAVQSYLASVSFVDHYVGEVLAALEKSPYHDNTIVIIFSDHGFHLGEKAHWAKRTLWEDGTRVPLAITGPGLPSQQDCERPVGLIDLYPTLLDLCGFDADPGHEGTTLKPLLLDPEQEWNRPALTFFGVGNVSVRSTDWRYIRYADGSTELYDHRTDPHEWHNLAGHAEYKKIKETHDDWIPKSFHPILGRGSTGHAAYKAAADRAQQKRSR